MSKALHTTEFIIEKVTPIFNKKGFYGTSMKDITNATGLTKGAIYGNFKGKEDLALAAFNTALKYILKGLESRISIGKKPLQKLFKITEFYGEYYDYTLAIGGCPLINIGIDANNQNLQLSQRVREIVLKWQNEVSELIDQGIKIGNIKAHTNSFAFAKRMFIILEGGIAISTIMNDRSYLANATKVVDKLIHDELLA
ncbi:TetR/AcrR family transcriptional regulator [Spongiivirga sp. MCCC 1A20706]|uniref:TetR/AcrR family transcriptional regulator n=1 Tax=Spongiivirga sp. MCCC 1A20706 TaxID=3160963 RepID=UPI003977486B